MFVVIGHDVSRDAYPCSNRKLVSVCPTHDQDERKKRPIVVITHCFNLFSSTLEKKVKPLLAIHMCPQTWRAIAWIAHSLDGQGYVTWSLGADWSAILSAKACCGRR